MTSAVEKAIRLKAATAAVDKNFEEDIRVENLIKLLEMTVIWPKPETTVVRPDTQREDANQSLLRYCEEAVSEKKEREAADDAG